MKRTFLHLALIIAVASCASGQQGTVKTAPGAERLREHVAYLASGKLEGRRTGTAGAEMAAKFIAEEFRRYGLRQPIKAISKAIIKADKTQKWAESFPSQELLGYVQPFPYVASVALGANNSMSLRPRVSGMPAMEIPRELRVGVDWMPVGWGASARVENLPAAYVGYGITAADLQHDDYAGADVKGRAVIAFAGTPDRDNPHGRFARYNDLRFKAAAARDHGAKALILIAREEKFQDDKLAKLVFDNANAGDAGLPVVVISRQIARRVLEPLANALITLELSENPGANKDAKRGDAQEAALAALQSRSALLDRVVFSISTDIVRRETQAYNVVGVLEGSDPKLKGEAIVIGAHYDHLGRGGQGSLAAREGEIHHGADDNASGVAALLELARQFSSAPVKLRRTLIFVAFGGEEEGLLGSKYYVEHSLVWSGHHSSPKSVQTVAMINLDMVGRMKDDKLVIGGVGTAMEWRELIARVNGDLKIKVDAVGKAQSNGAAHGDAGRASNGVTAAPLADKKRFDLALNEDGFGPSDHSSFYAKGTPVLFLFTGTHEDYHKPSDTAERINYEGLSRIADFVGDLVGGIDLNDRRPTYTLAKSSGQMGRATGFRVYLGTIPSYAEGNNGLKLDGVREGSPAEKAGLKAGDTIVKIAGREVRNVYDYTYLLGELKPDQEYEVEALRGGERLTLKLTPTARK